MGITAGLPPVPRTTNYRFSTSAVDPHVAGMKIRASSGFLSRDLDDAAEWRKLADCRRRRLALDRKCPMRGRSRWIGASTFSFAWLVALVLVLARGDSRLLSGQTGDRSSTWIE